MSAKSGFGGSIRLSGETEYKRALSQINQSLRETSSQMKVVTSSYDSNDKSLSKLAQQEEVLNKKMSEQEKKLNILKGAYSQMESQYATETQKHNDLLKTYNEEKAKLEEIGKTLGTSSKEYQEQEKKVADLTEEVTRSTKAEEDNEKSMSKMRQQINEAQADCNKTARELDNLGNEAEDTGKKAESGGQGFTVLKGVLADLGASAIRSALNGIKALGSALFNVGKQAIESYADYEQLKGGVETLFGDSADIVLKNSQKAFQTAGMSANEYMENVTSFSASLLQSLGGDTAKSAEIADMAMADMSDNANKMGTDMESITNAYQGFAKGQYQLLDNLKLGYGGTKGEMERLLADAQEFSGVEYNIDNLSDVYEAIHVIQNEMGITGTTTKEASTTISGSIGMMKSAWQNLLTGVADDNQNFGDLVSNFVDSLLSVAQNLLPRIQIVLEGLGTLVTELISTLLPEIVNMMNENSEQMIESATNLINALGDGILQALPILTPIAFGIIANLITNLVSALPQIVDIGMQILIQLINGLNIAIPQLIAMLPTIIKSTVTTLMKNLPLIIQAGCQLLVGIVNGLMLALPELISYVPTIIDMTVNTLIKCLPLITDASIQIMFALIDGLSNSAPQLVSATIKLIPIMVKALQSCFGMMIACGGKVLQSLVQGLIQRMPSLKEKAKEMGTSIVDAVKDLGSKMLSIGNDIVTGIWNGISNGTSWIKDRIRGWVGDVTNFIKKIFKIGSPSKLMADEVGQWLAKGIGVGFEDTMEDVSSQMADSIPTSFDVNASLNNGTQTAISYDSMVNAFKQAMNEMKIELDGDVAGQFVDRTVSRLIYT